MLESALAWNEYKCRKLIDEDRAPEIVQRHEVADRNNMDWSIPAERLIRTDETVRQALGFSAGRVCY